jgi:hypothetical protein
MATEADGFRRFRVIAGGLPPGIPRWGYNDVLGPRRPSAFAREPASLTELANFRPATGPFRPLTAGSGELAS